MADTKSASPDHYPVPRDDEEGLTIQRDWTEEEERKAKWKRVNTQQRLDCYMLTDSQT